MNGLIQKLRDDKEIQDLKKKYHAITGEWLGFHWDCFKDFDDYKDYMRRAIEEHNTTH